MIIVFLVLLDQITKYWAYSTKPSMDIVGKIFRLQYVQNTGAIFGWFQNANWIFCILAILLCIGILYYMRGHVKKYSLEEKAFYLILAGGIGNLIDRIVHGFVVDFMSLKYVGVFNVADACICVGITLLIMNQLFYHKKSS